MTATFELPGLSKENVQIDVHNNVLTVSGESKISSERDENGYAVRERRFGRFSRAIPLPQGVKVSIDAFRRLDGELTMQFLQGEDVKAAMENGVLTVTFPKSTPQTASQKITIA